MGHVLANRSEINCIRNDLIRELNYERSTIHPHYLINS